jgi:predicted nuclease of predicted toxin-antitoxin system
VRYLADESVERQIVDPLRQAGYEVDYIAETAPGADDPDALARANREASVLITGDKDFGELVYRRRQKNAGVVLLRLSGLTHQRKATIAIKVFASHAADFAAAFAECA